MGDTEAVCHDRNVKQVRMPCPEPRSRFIVELMFDASTVRVLLAVESS